MPALFLKNRQYYKFCLYGFLKNLRFFEPFFILYLLEKGLSYTQIGSLYAIRELGINLLEIPSGLMADALGRRRTLITSFFFYILSFGLFYLFSSFALFILAMLCFAVGEAFRSGTHKAMIFTYLQLNGWEAQKVYYYGHTRSWSQMGSALSALLSAAIVFYSGSYRYIFLCAMIPYFLDMLNILSYPKSLEGKVDSPHNQQPLAMKFREVLNAFWLTFKRASLLKAVNNLSIHSAFYKATKDYLQPVLQAIALSAGVFAYLQEKERIAILIGTIYFIIHFLSSISSRNSGRLADRFSSLPTALNFTLAIGIGMGCISGTLLVWQIPLLAVLFFVLIFIIENARKPIGVSYVADTIDTKILASVLSAESQLGTLWTAIFALLIGYLADYAGVGWGLLILSFFIALIVPLAWLSEKKG